MAHRKETRYGIAGFGKMSRNRIAAAQPGLPYSPNDGPKMATPNGTSLPRCPKQPRHPEIAKTSLDTKVFIVILCPARAQTAFLDLVLAPLGLGLARTRFVPVWR